MRANLAVLIGSRDRVLHAERIVDDLVTGKQRIVLALKPNAAPVPTDVVGLLDWREQFQRTFRREMCANRSDRRAELLDDFRDLRSRSRVAQDVDAMERRSGRARRSRARTGTQ